MSAPHRPIVLTELDQARFYAKVALPDERGCALWTASKDRNGYGRFTFGPKGPGRLYPRAHRVSYTIANGPIPDGFQIDHECHTPSCVAPHHLRAATNAENCQNRAGSFSNSRTGIRGVSWHRTMRAWQATVVIGGAQHRLGFFQDISEAERVVVEYRREHMPFSVMDGAVA